MALRSCRFNPYVELMYGEFAGWTFAEDASQYRGQWRQQAFAVNRSCPLDLEIGPGNGFHFAEHARKYPDRQLIGLELKYKPLVQSIRRCLRSGANNARMLRWDAKHLSEVFAPGEIDNVIIHHPDPWPKRRHAKNRLIDSEFLLQLHQVMKSGATVEFKTDHYDYFVAATRQFATHPFEIIFYSEDLHHSLRQKQNFVTQFEKIFLQKNQPIFYLLCRSI